MRRTICIVTLLLCFFSTIAQSDYITDRSYNRLGIQGKYAIFDISTDDFNVQSQEGFLGGFTTRNRLFSNFGLVYGIDFLIANLNIDGRALGQTVFENVEYSIIGAQVNVLLTYNILEEYLSVDFGPSLLINSNLRVRNDGQEDNIIRGFNSLRAEDIEDISGISPFLVVGLSGGFETIRFTIQYQYGFTNILENLNNQRLQEVDAGAVDFQGNASIFTAGVLFYL